MPNDDVLIELQLAAVLVDVEGVGVDLLVCNLLSINSKNNQ